MFFVGAYVPLTTEGTIMIDGILASCYTDFPHDLAHLAVKPMQKVYRDNRVDLWK